MKKYNNISEVWNDLDQNKTVFWENDAYKIYLETADCKYQRGHFSHRNGMVLSIRCIENFFGGLIDQSEIDKLFSLDAK